VLRLGVPQVVVSLSHLAARVHQLLVCLCFGRHGARLAGLNHLVPLEGLRLVVYLRLAEVHVVAVAVLIANVL